VADSLLGHLVLGHRRDELIVHEEPVDVERLGAGRIGCLELHRAAPLGVANPGLQRRLEQFRFFFRLSHEGVTGRWWLAPAIPAGAEHTPRGAFRALPGAQRHHSTTHPAGSVKPTRTLVFLDPAETAGRIEEGVHLERPLGIGAVRDQSHEDVVAGTRPITQSEDARRHVVQLNDSTLIVQHGQSGSVAPEMGAPRPPHRLPGTFSRFTRARELLPIRP